MICGEWEASLRPYSAYEWEPNKKLGQPGLRHFIFIDIIGISQRMPLEESILAIDQPADRLPLGGI
jgi:hypothetical protein